MLVLASTTMWRSYSGKKPAKVLIAVASELPLIAIATIASSPRPLCFERAWYAITHDPRHNLDTI